MGFVCRGTHTAPRKLRIIGTHTARGTAIRGFLHRRGYGTPIFAPKGLRIIAQGCGSAATLGNGGINHHINPNGVAYRHPVGDKHCSPRRRPIRNVIAPPARCNACNSRHDTHAIQRRPESRQTNCVPVSHSASPYHTPKPPAVSASIPIASASLTPCAGCNRPSPSPVCRT